MKINYTIIFTCLYLIPRVSQAGTPVRYTSINGIEFATHLVNGTTYYTFIDAQNHWQELGNISSVTVTVTTFTPSNFETNLSTCLSIVGFNNFSDWTLSQTKSGLREKMASFRHKLTGYSFDLNSPQYIDMAQRFDWLKSYYNTLP